MAEVIAKHRFDGIVLVSKTETDTVSIFAEDEAFDAITTLVNLLSEANPHFSKEKQEEADRIYRDFMNGVAFVSEGFWTRKFKKEELESFEGTRQFKQKWEKVHHKSLDEPVWLCANNWNDIKNYLTETVLQEIISFAHASFKKGHSV